MRVERGTKRREDTELGKLTGGKKSRLNRLVPKWRGSSEVRPDRGGTSEDPNEVR